MNGLELAKSAVALFQDIRGDESLYLQCQRFDGAYTQAAYQGNWDFETYDSARIAASVASDAGRIYTSDFNDSRIEAGEKVYYAWGQYGHVCSVIGRDAGGLLVTNTANSGDDLGQLGNHVKISHAHTLGLELIGISSRDGNNAHISNVAMFGGGVAPTPQPGGEDDWINLANWAWYTSAGDAVSMRNPHGKRWTGESYANGEYDVLGIEGNGAIKIRANDGSEIFIHPSARENIFYKNPGSGGSSSSGLGTFYVPDSGQYYYNKYENALNGNYDPSQMIFGGSRKVVSNPGEGPVQIEANDGSLIWVGTRNHPAQVS